MARTATTPRAQRARAKAEQTVARAPRRSDALAAERGRARAARAAERGVDVEQGAESLNTEAVAMGGLSDDMVARLAGAWGDRDECGDVGQTLESNPGGLELEDIVALVEARHRRARLQGYRDGYSEARRDSEIREQFVRREVLLGAFTMWRTELEQILKVASRPGASADVRRKEALEVLVAHTADVARQQTRLEEEAFGR